MESMSRPTVAVVGASTNRRKFGNKAVRAFRNAGYDVYPINLKAGEIEGLVTYKSLDDLPLERLDSISIYLPPATVLEVLDQVARKHAGEVWLNPGTASKEVVAKAELLGLNAIQACSILGVGEHPERL
jgi:predicted CoA-binding protein